MGTEIESGSANALPGREHPEGEELCRLLSDASFEALVVHDRGSILAANRAFADLLGYELAEVAGMDALGFAAPESRGALLENLGSTREESFRAMALRKDGTGFTAEVTGKGVRCHGLPFSKGETGQTGIGLAIVERIVRAYNGEVKACNKGGAVFEVTFRGGAAPGEEKDIHEE